MSSSAPHVVAGPSIPADSQLPDISHLSRAELQQLLGSTHNGQSNDDAFHSWVARNVPALKAAQQEEEALLRRAEELAEINMQLKPELEGLRRETKEYFDEARKLELEWPELERRQREAYKRFAPSSLLALLTQSTSKLHDESESLAGAFVEGLPLDAALDASLSSTTLTPANRNEDPGTAFVRRYRQLRATYHRQNIVAERWTRGTVVWRDE
ncbi:hypothetical protein IE81DRAFT_197340 [Ceraceosorus guamensis]|uniref:VPS37 C-terminal domain-containing protein n=1 Tax=Ceraceosorus guamensis TaxID=1522189 RepID=A0A316VTW5_9BASI|nr:hypothetical protein IE81DRAFT_197340 [Ceraceosorus guamensis]PWN41019.1 hypothetical protein IE81DRAFT_197340 [Ceraceosorus guamensis]